MTPEAKKRRKYWFSELAKLSGSFGDDSTKMIAELRSEIGKDGTEALLDHLRLCGAVPEHYGHDSSEEKLYSKYTDAIISDLSTSEPYKPDLSAGYCPQCLHSQLLPLGCFGGRG